jgi:hypothetical protein
LGKAIEQVLQIQMDVFRGKRAAMNLDTAERKEVLD